MTGGDISVELQTRTVVRKGLRTLRQNGRVPAVMHDHGKASLHVEGDFMRLMKVYEQAGKHHPVSLNIGGTPHLAIIKDVDFEPTKRRLRHVVFQAIKQNEKIQTEVPLVLDGDIPAEKASLMVLAHLDTLLVEAFPRDLVDELKVDASGLTEVGDKITVADVKAPAGLTILTDPDTLIAVVEMPKDQLADANAAQEEMKAAAEAEQPAEDAAPAEPTDEAAETK